MTRKTPPQPSPERGGGGRKAVIIGAGALGLGFLAERLAGDYDIVLADRARLVDYASRLLDRFFNPYFHDSILR
ncbi:MAG: hypothetical protein Q7T82_06575 [Armatimonadota bacterium]|nr:hypothetical protein [Armatimonadota bacterium]